MSGLPPPPVDFAAVAAQREEERARSRGLRLGDGWDALLVRELQQAIGSRLFAVLVGLALLAMLLLPLVVLEDSAAPFSRGPFAFGAVLSLLTLLVCGLVPLQAFLATRQEALGESAEALLLTRLTPWAIVRGKLTAANAHALLWASLASPLLALTWLLRGVSVPTILLGLLLALLGSMIISALAVAAGTLVRFERVAGLVNLLGVCGILAAGIVWTTFTVSSVGSWGSSWSLESLLVLLGTSTGLIAFAIAVARSQFTHPCENRSTPFRVMLPALLIASFAVMAPLIGNDDAYLVALVIVGLAFGPFLIFAATEEDALSLWLAQRVPRTPWRARLAAPLLPGGARGLLWGLLMTLLLLAGLDATEARTGRNFDLFGASGSGSDAARGVVLMALYALFYGAIGALVRPRLRAGPGGNWRARSFVLGVIAAGTIFPVLVQLLLLRESNWTGLQIFNPFWSIVEGADEPFSNSPILWVLLCFDAVLLLLVMKRLREGMEAIVAAGAARRPHES